MVSLRGNQRALAYFLLKTPTFDLQLAGDGGLSLGILGSAGVHATIEATRFTNLQRANALIGDLTKLWVISNDHLILQPFDFRLIGREKRLIYIDCQMNLEMMLAAYIFPLYHGLTHTAYSLEKGVLSQLGRGVTEVFSWPEVWLLWVSVALSLQGSLLMQGDPGYWISPQLMTFWAARISQSSLMCAICTFSDDKFSK